MSRLFPNIGYVGRARASVSDSVHFWKPAASVVAVYGPVRH
jgi:hypothetical protein